MASKRVRLRRTVSGLRMRSRDHLIRLRDQRLRGMGVNGFRPLLAVLVLLGLILLVGWLRLPEVTRRTFRPSEAETLAPMSGWAVRAGAWGEDDRLDAPLVYVEATWAELEPESGEYAFEAFEEKNHLEQWWAEGKQIIVRLVADNPGATGHKDIPEWLAAAMGGDELAGEYYVSSQGGGFSPNYSSLIMRDAHRRLIAALAERYDGLPGVAYIEIGTLGWRGEWTVGLDEGVEALPTSAISREYAWHYISAFRETPMLMRRPYVETQLLEVGLYHPNLGDFEATWDELDQIEMGGYDRQIETELVAMPDFYEKSPSGAHIREEIDLENLLLERPQELARQLTEGHLNYVVIEQSVASLSDAAVNVLEELQSMLGARVWLRSAEWDSRLRAGVRSKVILRFRNDGVAPIHAAWPVALALFDGEELICMQTTDVSAAMICPGENEFTVWIDVPDQTDVGAYTLKMAVVDPQTNQPSVRLTMDACDGETLWVELGELRVTG